MREEDVDVVMMRYDTTMRDYEPAISPFLPLPLRANPKKWITPDSAKLGDLLLFRRQIVRGQRDQRRAEQRGSFVRLFALSPVHARTNAIVRSRGQM